MNKLYALTESDLGSVFGGGSGDDSLARDLGQYVGGVARAYVEHPFLCMLPFYGQVFSVSYGIRAMRQ